MFHKRMFLLAICCLTAASTYGQVRVGLMGGANIATITTNDPTTEGIDSRTFASFGVVVDLQMAERLSLRVEPSYMTKGATLHVSELGIPGRNVLGYNYLELPVLVSFRLATGPLMPYLLGGGVLGYRVGAEDARIIRAGSEVRIDPDGLFKKMDLAATVGGGISYPVGRAAVFLEGRYTLGFSDIGSSSEEVEIRDTGGNVIGRDVADVDSIKNRGVLVSVGFTIPLGM